eukprot:1163973-Pyramimonas_sp.AAC.1
MGDVDDVSSSDVDITGEKVSKPQKSRKSPAKKNDDMFAFMKAQFDSLHSQLAARKGDAVQTVNMHE